MTLKGIGLLLASSGTLAGIVAACSPTASVVRVAPVLSGAPFQGTTQSVTKFWSVTCAKCHGEEGQGGGAGTGTLLMREKFGQENDRPYFDIIKNGHPENGMPSYGATMSDEEIWAQVVHIRELQARAVGDKAPPEEGGVFKGARASFWIEPVVMEGLEVPWALDWLPDGRMLVTEKKGNLRILGKDGKLSAPIEGLPAVRPIGQGGMMEVAAHPTNGFIYLSFTDPAKEDARAGMTKVVRGRLSADGARWTTERTIWEAPQSFYTGAGIHFGSRIAFEPGKATSSSRWASGAATSGRSTRRSRGERSTG